MKKFTIINDQSFRDKVLGKDKYIIKTNNMTKQPTLSGNQFKSKYEWFKNELQELDNEIINNSPEVILETYDCISMLILFKQEFTDIQYEESIYELKKRISSLAIQSQLRFPNGETTNAEYKFTVNGYRLDSKAWFNNWEQLKLSKGYTKNKLRSYENFIDFLTNIFTKLEYAIQS